MHRTDLVNNNIRGCSLPSVQNSTVKRKNQFRNPSGTVSRSTADLVLHYSYYSKRRKENLHILVLIYV